MAITNSDLAAGIACYRTLTPDQKRAIRIYGKASYLVFLGGTDYRTLLTTTLLSDAAVLTKGMDMAQLNDVLDYLTVRESSSSVPSIATLLTATKCLVEADPMAMKRAEVLLDSQVAFLTGG